MLEQEMASIIKFVLDESNNPAPYYWKVPESFTIPSVFFPPPEIVTGADTLSTYSMDYAWNIVMFGRSDQAAYEMGAMVNERIRFYHNLIPLIDTEGERIDGRFVRVDDPSTKLLDSGAMQLVVTWTSHRKLYRPQVELMQEHYEDYTLKGPQYEELVLTAAMEAALEQYLQTT